MDHPEPWCRVAFHDRAVPDSAARRAAILPGDWFAMSQMHEEYWLEARPILEEMERLRRLYGKVEARDGSHGLPAACRMVAQEL